MAKSKTLVKKEDAPIATKVASGSPYQLDPAQVEKAATALVAHMKKHAQSQEETAGKKSLAADEDEKEGSDDPIFLSVTTKQHVHDTSRLKPTKLFSHTTPHPRAEVRICIFTKDPQRAYKDLVAADTFPVTLRPKIGRVLGLDKLKKKYKSFESKRQLLAEYDVFMVDERIIKIVAEFLGKTFYAAKSKRPIPLRLTAGAQIDKTKKGENVVGTSLGVAREIEKALAATYVSMSASANTSVKVGKLSMTPQQLKENIEAVVEKLVEKHIEHKWRNVRGLYIKGPTTKALPIWMSEELWLKEEQVLEQAPMLAIKGKGSKGEKGDKKRKWDEWEEEILDEDDLKEIQAKRSKSKKSKSKKEPQNKELGTISKEKRSKLKKATLESVPTALVTG